MAWDVTKWEEDNEERLRKADIEKQAESNLLEFR